MNNAIREVLRHSAGTRSRWNGRSAGEADQAIRAAPGGRESDHRPQSRGHDQGIHPGGCQRSPVLRDEDDGGTDYLTAEPGTGRVFVSRATHVMVVDGSTGKVLGDIPDTPRTHGIGLVAKYNHGFTTNGGDSTVTMFDLKTLAVIKKIKVATGGLDGIMYDDFSNRIILTNHSRPIGTAVALDPTSADIVGKAELEDDAPEGAAS